MTNLWIEFELLLFTSIPSEFDVLVTRVRDQERNGTGFTNDAVADVKLILKSTGKSFKENVFTEAFTKEDDFVLFEHIVQGLEGKHELLDLRNSWLEADVEVVI